MITWLISRRVRDLQAQNAHERRWHDATEAAWRAELDDAQSARQALQQSIDDLMGAYAAAKYQHAEDLRKRDAEIEELTQANERQAEMLHAQEDALARAEGRPLLGVSAEAMEHIRHNATVDASTQAAEDRAGDVDADRDAEVAP